MTITHNALSKKQKNAEKTFTITAKTFIILIYMSY